MKNQQYFRTPYPEYFLRCYFTMKETIALHFGYHARVIHSSHSLSMAIVFAYENVHFSSESIT